MLDLALILLAFLAPNIDKTESYNVDVIELNHVYGENGAITFDQLIFWKSLPNGTLVVDGWRMLNNCRKEIPKDRAEWEDRERQKPEEQRIPYVAKFMGHHFLPVKKGRLWVSRLTNNENAGILEVYGNEYNETWTSWDREAENREVFPVRLRSNKINVNYVGEP